MQTRISTERKKSDLRPTVLAPPGWLFPAAAAATVVAGGYFLARLTGAGGSGLGFAPYMLLLLAAGIALLPMSTGRVEVDEEKVVSYRGASVRARCKTADLEAMRDGMVCKTLTFRGGAEIKLYEAWSNVDRTAAVVRKLLDGRERNERERQIRSGTALRRSA